MNKNLKAFDGKEFLNEEDCLNYEAREYSAICSFLDFNLKPTNNFGDVFVLNVPNDWTIDDIKRLDNSWVRYTDPISDFVVSANGITKSGIWIYIGNKWVFEEDIRNTVINNYVRIAYENGTGN